MKAFLEKYLPQDNFYLKLVAIGVSNILCWILSIIGIYVIRDYGIALFVLIPFFMGVCATFIYGFKNSITLREAGNISLISLLVFGFSIFLFAFEGLICILMAAPIAILCALVGALLTHSIINRNKNKNPSILLILFLVIPTTAFYEKGIEPSIKTVVTSIEINASPEVVWKNVIEFPDLNEPDEFLFKAGISYPLNANIIGTGVGAIRYCNFNTGSFVEPITKWEENSILEFDVLEQPIPMTELSIWDIDAPHLHDFFVSKKGQFKLIPLENGHTLLEGTTWYVNNIKPNFYWNSWSNYIIHKIHLRVLKHIKVNSESSL